MISAVVWRTSFALSHAYMCRFGYRTRWLFILILLTMLSVTRRYEIEILLFQLLTWVSTFDNWTMCVVWWCSFIGSWVRYFQLLWHALEFVFNCEFMVSPMYWCGGLTMLCYFRFGRSWIKCLQLSLTLGDRADYRLVCSLGIATCFSHCCW